MSSESTGFHVEAPKGTPYIVAGDLRGTRDTRVSGRIWHMTRHHLDHLRQLETEAIHLMREVAGEFERPAILFSGGKDSICLLRLAEKAFRPQSTPGILTRSAASTSSCIAQLSLPPPQPRRKPATANRS